MPKETDSEQHIKIKYANKPYYIQMKRVFRKVRTFPDSDKPKKLGFYLQGIRGVEGSAQVNEKIVKEAFGKTMEMSPNDLLNKIRNMEAPSGRETFIKPENNWQTTQRLIPNEKLNKTIQISVFSEIYDEIIKKYKSKQDAQGNTVGDNIIRA